MPNLLPLFDAFIIYHIQNCHLTCVYELFLMDYKQCQKLILPNYMT